MADKQYYLDRQGVERLVEYIKSALSTKVNIGDIVIPEDLVHTNELDAYTKIEDFNSLLPDELVYADELDENLANYATKEELDEVKEDMSILYHYCGSVENYEALYAIEEPKVGDVYNVELDGMNMAWNGDRWDELGSLIDLEPYLQKTDVDAIPIPEIDEIIFNTNNAVVANANEMALMLNNGQDDVKITLSDDVNLTSTLSVPAGKSVTLNLGGNEITGANALVVNGDLTINNGSVNGTKRTIQVAQGGKLELNNANVDSSSDCAISSYGGEVVMNGGEVTAQEVGILTTHGGTVVVNGGTIMGRDNFAIGGNGTAGSGDTDITINDGEIIGHIQSNGYIAAGIYLPNTGTFTMNGGKIVSDGAGIVMRGGQVNLNGGSIEANGATGVEGKVGDSRIVVGPYAVVYDAKAKYPAYETLELNIGENMVLYGTDGDIQTILDTDTTANINDNRA